MKLPKEKRKPTLSNPKLLIIFGKPKSGKTTAVAGLENNLIIDVEGGSDFLEGLVVSAHSSFGMQEGTPMNFKQLQETIRNLTKAKAEGFQYDYITIDTVTMLEDIIMPLAVKLYKDLPQNKDSDETNLKKLAHGAGYLYIREAFFLIIDSLKHLPKKGLILVGHLADRQITLEGNDMWEFQLDLTGKLPKLLLASADAIAYVYRKENKTIFNFNGGDEIICQARALHLRGQEIIIAEETNNNQFTYNWNKIFLD